MSKIKNMTETEDLALKEFVRKIKEAFGKRLKQCILFGSKARGDFDEESDMDILVVLDRVSNYEREEVWNIADDMILKYGVLISPRVIDTEEEVAKQRYGILFYREIEKNGKHRGKSYEQENID
ncbi:MAG: nucleotidyltransferase domain-containing protein [Candidatus Marinimicrobia bacterium]|nr:nucleotidyltransferase domain-containing protein [Candidatus Neomarinimicrobiota bacterium]